MSRRAATWLAVAALAAAYSLWPSAHRGAGSRSKSDTVPVVAGRGDAVQSLAGASGPTRDGSSLLDGSGRDRILVELDRAGLSGEDTSPDAIRIVRGGPRFYLLSYPALGGKGYAIFDASSETVTGSVPVGAALSPISRGVIIAEPNALFFWQEGMRTPVLVDGSTLTGAETYFDRDEARTAPGGASIRVSGISIEADVFRSSSLSGDEGAQQYNGPSRRATYRLPE